MKLAKGEEKKFTPTKRVELEIEETLVDQLAAMEKYTKISRGEIVSTALKRFISQHKDYLPG